MHRIAVLTNSMAQEAFLAEQLLRFCAEHCLFPQMDCYRDQESFFEAAHNEPLTNALIALPGVDGLNAVEHLRTLCPQTRIIWCSDLNFSLHAFRLRADYFLLEPVTEDALRQGFCSWLDQEIRQRRSGLTATNTTRRTVYEKEKYHPFCVKPVPDSCPVPFHGCLRRNAAPADSSAASAAPAPSAAVQPRGGGTLYGTARERPCTPSR